MNRLITENRSGQDGERPFWISYADLMTALMILFLVIMVTALASISHKKEEVIIKGRTDDIKTTVSEQRAQEIFSVCRELSKAMQNTEKNAVIDCKLNRINFGEAGRFKTDEYKLSAAGEQLLNNMVPLILSTANTPLGKKWLKRVVIEGFTDTDGSYLYNLNLSLKRSEWVMCKLLSTEPNNNIQLSSLQRKEVKKLFLAGGVSFNNIRYSKDASRRVELKLEFYGVDKTPDWSSPYEAKFDEDTKEKCQI